MENGLENNFTITFPSNTNHKSHSTELLTPWICSNSFEFTELKLSNCKNFCLTACLPPTLIDLSPKLLGMQPPFFQGQSLFPSTRTFLVIMSLSLVYDKSAFLHDGYTAAIEISCAPIADKHTLFLMRVASLLLSASFNMTFATRIISLLLGALFNTKLLLQNFILEHYSYCIIKCL